MDVEQEMREAARAELAGDLDRLRQLRVSSGTPAEIARVLRVGWSRAARASEALERQR